MELKDILVHIDPLPNSATRAELAVGLSKRHQARLTGLMVSPHPDSTEAAVARAMFEEKVAGAGIDGRWHCVDGSGLISGPTEAIRAHAHCSDLVIVGQGSRESVEAGTPLGLPEYLVLVLGLPVLIVPYVGSFASLGERVLVAWKAGRESTRALNDAIPILKRAQRVEVLTAYGPETRGVGDGGLSADLCRHLARHGVTAKATRLSVGQAPMGDLFLNRACDEGFDLLVMGAYAHGKDGKPELGPVARQLLREMTVPVLMSH